VGLSKHSIFADEVTWMVRGKGVYAAIHSRIFYYFDNGWWLDKTTSEPIGLPMSFLGGVAMSYLSPGYSNYSLNITKDFIATRIPSVFVGSLFVPIFYLLLRKHIDDKLAFITSLLMSLDPISIALSRWFHQDMALMIFSSLSLLTFIYKKNKITTIVSAFLAAMAILTKPQGFLVPITLIIFSCVQFLTTKKVNIKKFIFWLILTSIFIVLFFPFLWNEPINGIIQYLAIQYTNAVNGQITFFNGNITTNPLWYYYFAIFPFRIPESIFIGFIIGFILTLFGFKKGFIKNSFVQIALIYSILFITVISISSKKLGIRYLFAVWPYIYVLATYGLFKLSDKLKWINKKIFWIVVFVFQVWGIVKFYPSYYLFYNHFITPQKMQNLESIAFCDSVKPAIEYLEPNLYHGIIIMLMGCDSTINYYTGNTIKSVYNVNDNPNYIIEENYDAQLNPNRVLQIENSEYKKIKEIYFRGLIIAKIYQKPSDIQ